MSTRSSLLKFGILFLLAKSNLGLAQLCNPGTDDCNRTLVLPDLSQLEFYSSYPVDQLNEDIERLVLIIHGNSRAAEGYFKLVFQGAEIAGGRTLSSTLILSPKFKVNTAEKDCENCDPVGPKDLFWSNQGWKQGDAALSPGYPTSSFAVIDELLLSIVAGRAFPQLKNIVIAGHSAGGQFVNRYSIRSSFEDSLSPSFHVRYVVANPSSYLYLDKKRPDWAGLFTSGGKYPGQQIGQSVRDTPNFYDPYRRDVRPFEEMLAFNPIRIGINSTGDDLCNCTGAPPCAYERYKFGFDIEPKQPEHYFCTENSYQTCSNNSLSSSRAISRFLERDIVYMLGQDDNSVDPSDDTTNAALSTSCGSNFQGPDRLSRGVYYFESLSAFGEHNSRLLIIGNTGHSTSGMFTNSYKGRRALFGGDLPKKEELAGVYTMSQSLSKKRYFMTGEFAKPGRVGLLEYDENASHLEERDHSWVFTQVSNGLYRIQQRTNLYYFDSQYKGSDPGLYAVKYASDSSQLFELEADKITGAYYIKDSVNAGYLNISRQRQLVFEKKRRDVSPWNLSPVN